MPETRIPTDPRDVAIEAARAFMAAWLRAERIAPAEVDGLVLGDELQSLRDCLLAERKARGAATPTAALAATPGDDEPDPKAPCERCTKPAQALGIVLCLDCIKLLEWAGAEAKARAEVAPVASRRLGPIIDAFHAHLDACTQCREHPFDLCPVGAPLLVKVAPAAAPAEPKP